ncbi:MAG: D-tyrosyl-tRNA(Tyr) deacylase [Clostridia bacterium]|nr:D-tyrosyl-tRNA(Tyr) deacylase [Clostridia bacterium]
MKAVIQRVSHAKVTVDGVVTGECGKGLAILLGVAEGDSELDAELLSTKIAKLRIFTDENDKMNLSLIDVEGGAVVVSQFTLLANYKKGNRPDYLSAAAPAEAERLYEYFIKKFEEALGKTVGRGVFGAHMAYDIHNDGPVTIVMESDVLKKK